MFSKNPNNPSQGLTLPCPWPPDYHPETRVKIPGKMGLCKSAIGHGAIGAKPNQSLGLFDIGAPVAFSGTKTTTATAT